MKLYTIMFMPSRLPGEANKLCELQTQMHYCNARWTCVASGVANRLPRNPVFIGKRELNRGRWEERETKAYLAGDPVDADFPGVTMVIRTFRQTWKVVWKGKRDNGYHEDKLTRRMDLNIMSAMMVARSRGMWVCA